MIKVLKEGLFSTIQDKGRFGYKNIGVPVSGSMDQASAKLANLLLGNDESSAVLEMTLLGPTLEFMNDTYISITGADMNPSLNKQKVLLNKPLLVNKGDILCLSHSSNGMRSYLGVKGGLSSENKLGSKSFYKGITKREKLIKNDKIKFGEVIGSPMKMNKSINDFKINRKSEINVFKGPEFGLLDSSSNDIIFNTDFTIGINNRMGYNLVEPIKNSIPSIVSSPVMPGTVQLTPSGRLIILCRDCQTTGGYPRVLQLDKNSIDSLSQKTIGEIIKFKLV
ncbi:MAG: biotin-dependent carboxyltransferase family protein [Bacteroidota bacterium]|nr:biotin-dependent carboxyltransferase family protein [Bacteroidota bacterium]